MAGPYRKKNAPRRNSNWLGHLLLILVVFIAGYMSASLCDYASLSSWINTNLLANNTVQSLTKPVVQQAQLPKPKFEFYTLLANERVAGSSQPATDLHANPAQQSVPTTTIAVASDKKPPLHVPLVETAAAGPAPVVAAEKIPELLERNKNAYLVQVASFKSMREAERMKAGLVMKGFDVKITMASQQQVNWYRFIIGPFSSKSLAQEARLAFAKREHIMGMVRRMDA